VDISAVCDPEGSSTFPSCRLYPITALDTEDKFSGDRLGSPFLTAGAVSSMAQTAQAVGTRTGHLLARQPVSLSSLQQENVLLESKSPPTS